MTTSLKVGDTLPSRGNNYILTPYYLEIVNVNESREVPDQRFRDYDLFCILTRISPLITNPSIYPNIEMDLINGKMRLNIKFYNAEKQVPIREEERELLEARVKEIERSPRYCLLYRPKNYWEWSILPYLLIPSILSPTITDEGLLISIDPLTNFKTIFMNEEKNLHRHINTLRKDSAIMVKNEDIIKKWDLVQFNGDLHIPNWTDERFTRNQIVFLLERIMGIRDIFISIDNRIDIFSLNEFLLKKGIKNEIICNKIRCEVDTINEAKSIMALIDEFRDIYFIE